MSAKVERKRLNVITVYTQTEVVHTNGVRRIAPIYVRPIDKRTFGKSKTVFSQVTSFRVEFKKIAKLMPYIPVRTSSGRTDNRRLLDVTDMDFHLKPVKDYFTPIRKKITAKKWYRREDCFKYLLTAGLDREVSPRSSVYSAFDTFSVWLKDHNYYRTDTKPDSGGSPEYNQELSESEGHSSVGSECRSGQSLKRIRCETTLRLI